MKLTERFGALDENLKLDSRSALGPRRFTDSSAASLCAPG